MHRRQLTLVVVALALAAAGCITTAPPEGPAPLRYRDQIFTNVTRTTDVTYGSAPDYQGTQQSLELDVYAPQGDSVTNRPAIVWVHGGGFSGGDKTSAEIVDEATTFAKKGYVNVSIEYRLRPTGCLNNPPPGSCAAAIADAQHDAQAAVRFLRANRGTYGIDPTRIGIGGTSAGAVTALNVGFNADDPGSSGNPGPSSAVRGAVSLSGAHLGGTAEKTDAPILLFHGTADPLVPYVLATRTMDEARAAGIPAFLVTWEGEGHVPYGQHRQEILDTTTNFLYSAMDLAHAAR
jgi:acetyl esterase/lipase